MGDSSKKKSEPTLAERYYEGKKITGEHRFNSRIAGVSFKSNSGVKRQKLVKKLKAGDILYLIPDRHNRHDANAIMVLNRMKMILDSCQVIQRLT